MPVEYKSEITYKDISGYRYGLPEDVLKLDNPEESCFCVYRTTDMTGNYSCFLDGVMDFYSCTG